MSKTLRLWSLSSLLLAGIWGCGGGGGGSSIEGPGLPTGPGRAFVVRDVSFPSVDGVQVSALAGQVNASTPRPAVILVHDLFGVREDWLFFFENLFNRGYLPLSISLRGHGLTPLPDDGRPANTGLLFSDLENFHLDVLAALAWLREQPGVDAGRVAVVGGGVGGNVAYVSLGAFPGQLKTGVALSPGVWDPRTVQPLVIGASVADFAPHSLLFMVADQDNFTLGGLNQPLVPLANALASLTQEPKSVTIFRNSNVHGFALLNDPQAADLLLDWLDTHL